MSASKAELGSVGWRARGSAVGEEEGGAPVMVVGVILVARVVGERRDGQSGYTGLGQ